MDNSQSLTLLDRSAVASDLTFFVVRREAGEAHLGIDLLKRAWDEFIELHVVDKADWIAQNLLWLSEDARYEIGIHNGTQPVGGMVLQWDVDPHVGECLSVVTQFVLPEYRNKGVSLRCMREAVRLAKREGAKVLAYSHRVGDWRYEIIYKRIHNG